MSTATATFTDKGFWAKITRHARAIGWELLVLAFTLYHAMTDPRTPVWARAAIGAALAYLICPLDAIPDFVPGGYADDLGVLLGASATVAAHVRPEHRQKAEDAVTGMLG